MIDITVYARPNNVKRIAISPVIVELSNKDRFGGEVVALESALFHIVFVCDAVKTIKWRII